MTSNGCGSLSRTTCHLGDPAKHFPAWTYLLRYHGKYWKTLVHRAVELDRLHDVDQWRLRCLHAQVFDQLWQNRDLCVDKPESAQTDITGHYGCMMCKRRCRSKAGEAVHMFRCHGHAAEFRTMSDTTSCPACLREYHTIDRLHAHLRWSADCRGQLRGRRQLRALPRGIGSRVNEELRRRHNGLLPFQHGQGPHRERVAHIEAQGFNLEVYEGLSLLVFERDHRALPSLLEPAMALISGCPISWTALRDTLTQWLQDFDEETCALAGVRQPDIVTFADRLRDFRLWPFLVDPLLTPDPGVRTEQLALYEAWCIDLAAIDEIWLPSQHRPRASLRERIVLHAYSGRRRHGDFQWFLDRCQLDNPGTLVHVVSVDIVIDPHLGNISDPTIREFWYHGMRQGYVAGLLSGPPCCTWSRARGKIPPGMPQHKRAPRVLRDLARLWGFHSVSLREKMQLMDGHTLLAFSLQAMCILATTGGIGALEHPDDPRDDQNCASIWRLPIVNMLLQLPGMAFISLAQGLLGAQSPKPTGLMTLNLPSLPSEILRWAVCKNLPRRTTIGVNATGEFRTAGLKEYPPAFCAALAHAFSAALIPESSEPATQSVPEDFLSKCKKLVCTEFGEHFGPDWTG